MKENTSKEAIIFNIQKFTVHDGPGIRTTIFFKGCPMNCQWCSNPESIKPYPQVGVFKKDCIGIEVCGRCLHACPHQDEKVLQVENGYVTSIDRSKCRNCLLCADACPNDTLKVFGRKYTLREVLNIIMEDRQFYRESNGGVTCGGGDPMLQYQFIRELFKECRRYGVHTCLETELQCKQEALEEVLPFTDLLITDIKVMDSQKHKQYTGAKNGLILDNIKFAVEKGAKVIIRTPVVPGYIMMKPIFMPRAPYLWPSKLKNPDRSNIKLLPYRLLGLENMRH